jgi:hypothetical protein
MSLRIVTADERLAEARGVKACILGKSGEGKTSLLFSLPTGTTLFADLEAGDLAVQDWPGSTIRLRTWQECRDFAVFIGGPNPALRDDQPYSAAHHAAIVAEYAPTLSLDAFDTIFIDSITVAGRLCFQWCRGQPEAFADRTGKADIRGAYGLHGREMLAWLTHLQHTRARNVIFVGILDEKLDDFNRRVFSPQIDGSKTGLELPGIVDEVLTLAQIKGPDGISWRLTTSSRRSSGRPSTTRISEAPGSRSSSAREKAHRVAVQARGRRRQLAATRPETGRRRLGNGQAPGAARSLRRGRAILGGIRGTFAVSPQNHGLSRSRWRRLLP